MESGTASSARVRAAGRRLIGETSAFARRQKHRGAETAASMRGGFAGLPPGKQPGYINNLAVLRWQDAPGGGTPKLRTFRHEAQGYLIVSVQASCDLTTAKVGAGPGTVRKTKHRRDQHPRPRLPGGVTPGDQ